MNYSFEYIDIILLAMIAGFIFLRLRGILGKKSGFEDKMSAGFAHDFPAEKSKKTLNEKTFDEKAKKDFLSGAKIAYETIITSFSSGNLKNVKPLLDKKVYDQFDEAIKTRDASGQVSETTFIGIDTAEIKNHENKKRFFRSNSQFCQ